MIEHDARSVANEILRRAWDDNHQVTHLKVMKLVYFSHAWMLGLYHEPLFWQPVEAWRLGPVIRDVYNSLRKYGGKPIRHLIGIETVEYTYLQTDLLNQVWKKYKVYSPGKLSAITHAKGTPWHVVRKEYDKVVVIPDPVIEDYYARKARSAT